MIARILLIEDDQDLLELFADALNKNGFSVDRFSDPLKAVSVFEQNPDGYDLVLSDIRMPGMTGLELVRKMKEKADPKNSVRVILRLNILTFYPSISFTMETKSANFTGSCRNLSNPPCETFSASML